MQKSVSALFFVIENTALNYPRSFIYQEIAVTLAWFPKYGPESIYLEDFWTKSSATASNLSLSFHISACEVSGPVILNWLF